MRFTKQHIWFNQSNNTIGISDYAQQALGDIVYIDLPEVGQVIKKGNQFGSIESVKSVSTLFAPISMKVLEINEFMEDNPEIINTDPYGEGWILKVEIMNEPELQELLSEKEYTNQLTEK